MFEFMAKRINVQLNRLKKKNPNAFMFIDEPGLQFIFSAMSGYGEQKARVDLDEFFSMIDAPRGIHLCGNPDWDFLLSLDMDILSFDVYSNAEIFAASAPSIKKFLNKGGILVWGIIPTGFETFEKENLDFLSFKLNNIWKALGKKGIDIDQIVRRSMLSPATCCLVNADKEKTVEKAFQMTRDLSRILRENYNLS